MKSLSYLELRRTRVRTIEIDDEVFAYLQKHARAFVDSPNSVCRRIFEIDSDDAAPAKGVSAPITGGELNALPAHATTQTASRRSKAPKADLRVLVKRGLLRAGQTLFLIDYKGRRVPDIRADVVGGYLSFKGEQLTMSYLAQRELASVGFESGAVRGPAHWATEDGKTITELWQQYRNAKA
jgi:hypothetical protein